MTGSEVFGELDNDTIFCSGAFCTADVVQLNSSLANIARQPGLTSFAFDCSGSETEVRRDWLLAVSSALSGMPELASLYASLGFMSTDDYSIGDDLPDFISGALAAAPSLSNLTLDAIMSGVGDQNAEALGKAISSGALSFVALNLRLNDEGDVQDYLTGEGTRDLVVALGKASSLQELVLVLEQCVDVGAEGMSAVGDALAVEDSFPQLRQLTLNMETTVNDDACGDDRTICNEALTNLGTGLNALSAKGLDSLVLRLGANRYDEDGEALFAAQLQCAIDRGLEVPDFTDKCECDLIFDENSNCLKRNGGDDEACFVCNSTTGRL